MRHAQDFFDEATSVALGYWPVTLALGCAAAWAILVLWRSASLRSWPVVTLVASSALAFAGWFLLSVFLWVDSPGDTAPSSVGGTIVDGLTVAYLLVIVATIALAKGRRLASSGVAAFLAWLNLGPMIVSSMAVSASWM